MLYRCYAKINLTLEILKRRDDGYHDLASVIHTVSLADDLSIEPADELITRVEGLEPELLENNLVTRAARLLASTAHVDAGAQLTLVKRVPSAGGLGGGSADAAATLVGLNRYWQTRLGYHALEKLALQLGSDVPFFLRGGAALMRGRGEDLQALPSLPAHWLVLVVPSSTLRNKTASLFRALQPGDFSSGAASDTLARQLEQRQLDPTGLVNGFERAARESFAGLDTTWRQLELQTGRTFHLTGAGPTLFCVVNDRADARALAAFLQHAGLQTHAVRTVKHARASTGKYSA
jgi:4-diphosphocytidyl-2-C-methyl-D-erythritol kinase